MIRFPRRRFLPAIARPRGRTMAANAAIVAAAFLVSRVLGMLREIVIAARLGTSDTYDAYVAAFRIPDLLFALVVAGAFGSAFLPVFGGHLARGDADRAWRLANSLLTYAVVALLIVAQLIFLFTGSLMRRLIAPELPPDGQELATNLTRLLLLSPLLLGLGAAGKGMLEAHDEFLLPAIAPILYNVGIIVGAVALVPFFDVYGLAVGVIIGAAGHVAVQFANLYRRGFRYRPTFARQTEGLAAVARLMAPRVVGQAAGQANLIVMTNFASGLGEGRISALNYANHLVLLPHGVLALSLATVIFPRMVRQYGLGRLDEVRQTLHRALGPLVFLMLPAVVTLFAFRTSIVQSLFQFGSFTPESTALVATAVAYFAPGLLARSVVEATTRAFYAMHDTRTPVAVAVFAVAANIGLSWLLAPRLGHGGLALSISITSTLRMVILLAILWRRVGGIGQELRTSLPRMVLAAAALAAFALVLADPLARITDPAGGRTIWTHAAFVFALAGAGLLYLAAAYWLRIPECARLLHAARHRIG